MEETKTKPAEKVAKKSAYTTMYVGREQVKCSSCSAKCPIRKTGDKRCFLCKACYNSCGSCGDEVAMKSLIFVKDGESVIPVCEDCRCFYKPLGKKKSASASTDELYKKRTDEDGDVMCSVCNVDDMTRATEHEFCFLCEDCYGKCSDCNYFYGMDKLIHVNSAVGECGSFLYCSGCYDDAKEDFCPGCGYQSYGSLCRFCRGGW